MQFDLGSQFEPFCRNYEGENKTSVVGTHKLIYALSDTVGEGYGLNRGKVVIGLITGQVPAPLAIGNNVLLDSD